MREHNRALVIAGSQLQRVMLDLVREAYDEKAEHRPRYEGDRFPELTPTAMAGLWASVRVARLARREELRQARRAREAGHTWDEIGQALELDKPRDQVGIDQLHIGGRVVGESQEAHDEIRASRHVHETLPGR